MNDNDVIAIVIQVIRAGLDSFNMSMVAIKQGYQPRQTGTEPGPVIHLHKITAPRYGHPGKFDQFRTDTSDFEHTESIWRTPTFQIDGLSTQDPANTSQLTASDIVEAAADVLQTTTARLALLASNIGIERIDPIRESYFIDDRDRHEQSPSFDFVLDYRREFKTTVQPVVGHTIDVRRTC